ncbi:ABC transporter permease [Nocardioides caeni]|uniref:ABC transporter permease subunit n=1 Tax=Nocardioides caeni TaxID=574700 RepID=A0A4S8NT30_9ACTN|nr:ABC transporter permease subunit [Nocardioides caeni]THV18354.1 ABC transporter permease subunit [Nocardioides caeni]
MTWLEANRSYVLDMLLQHVQIAVPAVLISIVAAVALGRLAWRWRRVGAVVLGATSLLYSVPALPLLIVIPVVLSIPLRSDLNLIIALALYGTALLAGTALDAFRSVDPRVREAAEALGHSRAGIWWKVDLPLSFPVLLSGIRVITVSTVSLVTIGALVGIQSLGNLLTDGFQRGIHAEIVTGIVLTILVAVVLDVLLVLVGALVTPWRRRTPRARSRRRADDTAAVSA